MALTKPDIQLEVARRHYTDTSGTYPNGFYQAFQVFYWAFFCQPPHSAVTAVTLIVHPPKLSWLFTYLGGLQWVNKKRPSVRKCNC